MENFEFIAFLKALLFMQVSVHLQAIAKEIKEPDKVISRDGPNDGIRYVNFVEDKFSYLNITALHGEDFVNNMPECSFACLDTPSCFSFNLGAVPDVNDRFPCKLLPETFNFRQITNNSNGLINSPASEIPTIIPFFFPFTSSSK